MIPVYFGKKFTIIVEGSVWQPVVCEHCNLEWAFRVRIAGVGRGQSPYMLDNRGAKARAAKRAQLALEEDRQLSSEGAKRNVPCPGCGRYQRDMVESLRAGYASAWGAIGVVSILFGIMIALRGVVRDSAFSGESVAWLAGGAVVIAGGVTALVWRRRLQRGFDPNSRPVPSATGAPYQQPADAAPGADSELGDSPEVITRLQYEEACADALARGTDPPPPIRWRSA